MKVTSSEWYVLECLWREEPKTLMQLAAELKEEQGWAKSTCATMLKRMEEKKLISHEEKGRTKYFYAQVSRDEIAGRETREFLNRIYHGSVGLMMSALVEKGELSREEIRELEKILEQIE